MICKKCGKEIPEGMELCAECSMAEALDNVQVVRNEKKHLNKKIIIAICAAVILATGATVAVILSMAKDSPYNTDITEYSTEENEYVSTYTDENGNSHSVVVTKAETTKIDSPDNKINTDSKTKAQSTSAVQTAPAENPNKIGDERKEQTIKMESKIENTLTAFFNGKFYFSADMYTSGDQPTRMEMAINGNNLEGIMYDSEMTMGIMQLDGKTYFFNPTSNKYIEFTEELAETLGISMSDMNFGNFSEIFGKSLEPKAQYDTSVNGEEAVCYEFTNDSGSTKFYFVNETLKEINQYNAKGELETQFAVSTFSPTVPSNMLTLNGLTKAKSILSIMN